MTFKEKALKERKTCHASWHRDGLHLPFKKMSTGSTRQQCGWEKEKEQPRPNGAKEIESPEKKEGLFYH